MFALGKNFDYNKFADALGLSESSNSYTITNGIAYGRYQFTPDTIVTVSNLLNENTPSLDNFISNPNMQDTYFKTYVDYLINRINNNSTVKSQIGNFIIGKTNGITANINIYGLVAGDWLGGPGGDENLFINGYDANDGRTYISDYIAKFSKQFS
jgi:hypothetical protein